VWISTRAQYGLRALLEIGARGPEPVPLKEVAEAQRISQHYLEQIASALRRAGFIRSVRGAKGGYRLARPPEEIRALEVVETLEGSVAPVGCIEDPESCWASGTCATEELWRQVDLAVRSVLAQTTLKDLIERQRLLAAARAGGPRKAEPSGVK